ncbi:MAG: phage tail protein [Deltaproteobacteria bacterium]
MSVQGARIDPLKSYNFLVTLVDSTDALTTSLGAIQSVAVGGFSECSGLEMQLETERRQEGGNNATMRNFPTRVTWSNLRLKRGVTVAEDLWNWHYAFVEGRGRRRDGIVVLQNDLHVPLKAWHFRRALPVKWTGPTFNAMRAEVAVEELEIMHEGLELFAPGTALAALGSLSS